MEDLHKIKEWLRKRETEDPIPTKSKDRVFTNLARSIRRTKPLRGGRCQLCGGYTERLIPVVMKVCKNCCRSFLKKGDGLTVLKTEFQDYYCDNCLGRTWTPITINPRVCERCSRRIYRRHRYGLVDMRRRMALNELRKPFFKTIKTRIRRL